MSDNSDYNGQETVVPAEDIAHEIKEAQRKQLLYGAGLIILLLLLVSPVDLIPEQIPGIGSVDDIAYAVLTVLLNFRRDKSVARVAGLKTAQALEAGAQLPDEIFEEPRGAGCLTAAAVLLLALGAGLAVALGLGVAPKHAVWGVIPAFAGGALLALALINRPRRG